LEPFGSILGAAGSIASLISLYFCWKISETWGLRISLIFVLLLAGCSSYFSFQYYESTKPELVRQKKQQELREAIKKFINEDSLHASYYEPGESEGLINSGLIILEQYKELYP
jgi:F0F1-type ATP synthase membrane subunit a